MKITSNWKKYKWSQKKIYSQSKKYGFIDFKEKYDDINISDFSEKYGREIIQQILEIYLTATLTEDDKNMSKKKFYSKIFYEGSLFDAYSKIEKIIKTAKNEIILIDGFVTRIRLIYWNIKKMLMF